MNRVLYNPFLFFLLFVMLCFVPSCTDLIAGEILESENVDLETKAVYSELSCSAFDFCRSRGFWNKFHSLKERMEAIQISPEQLDELSTEQLLFICLNSPLNCIYTAYNNELKAVNLLADNLGFFRLFEARDNAAEVLVNVYSNLVVDPEQNEGCILKGDRYYVSLLTCNFLELYIISARIPKVFDSVLKDELEIACEKCYKNKQSHPESFGWISTSKEVILHEEIKSSVMMTPDRAKEIYQIVLSTRDAKTRAFDGNYVNFSLCGYGAVQTIGGQSVQYYRFYEMTLRERVMVEQEVLSLYGMAAIRKSGPSTTYNCHAFAWHMDDNPSNYVQCWINYYEEPNGYENVSKYWTNDYYHETQDELAAQKVFYQGADHSATLDAESPGMYISKWGYGPLMIHSLEDCPYDSSDVIFYSSSNENNEEDDSGDDNSGNIGGGGDREIIVTPDIPEELSIFGFVNIIANQTYSYQILPIPVEGEVHWSCLSDAVHFESSVGNIVSLSADTAGWYILVVEHVLDGNVVNSGSLPIYCRDN